MDCMSVNFTKAGLGTLQKDIIKAEQKRYLKILPFGFFN